MTESEVQKVCPACGEPIRENWKFCPACEISLESFICPQCNIEVKEHWKICPECGTRLLCKSCNGRIQAGDNQCAACKSADHRKQVPDEILVEPATQMEFIHVPAGVFMMGDTFGEGMEDEQPVHEVHLDGFYLGKYPVTQAQWKSLLKDNPSNFVGDDLPVESVTLEEVQAFIQEISRACPAKYQFSLPTEAQWEYAARSGGLDEIYSGSYLADLVAWYNENSEGRTHPVGTKAPNGLGIHDMSGNVWEWCQDSYRHDAYHRHQQHNPICTDGEEDLVIRGGSWNIDAWSVRCSRRFRFSKAFSAPGLGFRLVIQQAG